MYTTSLTCHQHSCPGVVFHDREVRLYLDLYNLIRAMDNKVEMWFPLFENLKNYLVIITESMLAFRATSVSTLSLTFKDFIPTVL